MSDQLDTLPHPSYPGRAGSFIPDERVQVRNRFDGAWCDGFAVADVVVYDPSRPPRYRLRRLSDGTVLPAQFGEDELATAS